MSAKKHLHVDWQEAYGRFLDPLDLDSQEFRFTAIRPGSPTVSLDPYIEQVTWKDEGNQYNLNTIPVLRGTMTWRADDDDVARQLHLGDGHRVRCEVRWVGTWTPLWEMRLLKPPSRTVEDGTCTVEMADDLQAVAQLSKGDFRYVKSKRRRPRGWRYHEIVANVCKRYRIPVAKLTAGTAWITKLGDDDLHQVTPLEVIRQAVLAEQEYTGQNLVITWRWEETKRRFSLHITSLRRNPVLYTLSDDIRNVTVEPVRRSMFATSVVAHGSSKHKGGKRKRYKPVRATSKTAVRRYGFIERHVTVPGNADGHGDLVRKAKHELAKQMRVVRNISTLRTYGIATVRRGDTIRVSLPHEGYLGDAGIVFVTSVEHTLTPGDYVMSLTLQRIDPLDPNRMRRQREKAARERKRRSRSKHR